MGDLSFAEYAAGSAGLAITLGCTAGTAWLVQRRRLSHLRGAPQVVALGILVTAALVAVHLVPGILGVLSRFTAPLCALVLLVVVARFVRPVAGAERESPRARPSSRASWGVAGVGCLLLAAWVIVAWWERKTTALGHVDLATFDLPIIATWIQSGSLWGVTEFAPLQSHGSYPHNGDLMYLAATLPWRNDFLVRSVDYPFFGLAGVAVYALACELRARRATAALAAALFLATPITMLAAFDFAMPDVVLLATFAGGALYLVRYLRTQARTDLVLAGLGLGLAFGAKWYGVTTVVVLLGVWVVARLLSRRPLRVVAAETGVLASLVGIAGGFWLLRNAISYGSPIFPREVSLFGVPLFDGPADPLRDRLGHTIADYLGDGQVWSDVLLPAYGRALGLPAALIAGATVLAIVALLAVARRRLAVLVLAAAALLVAAVYTVTPDTAFGPPGQPVLAEPNTRYLIPGLVLGAPLVAWLVRRWPHRRRLVAEVVVLLAVVVGLSEGVDVPGRRVAALFVLFTLAAAAAWAARNRLPAVASWLRRPAVGASVAVCGLVAAFAFGARLENLFNDERYVGLDPTIDWVLANAPEDTRIGLTGQWNDDGVAPVSPMFGPRMRNDVAFVGRDEGGLLHNHDDGAEWAEAVRRGRYDLLLVGRYREPGRGASELDWVRRLPFRQVAASERFVLYSSAGDRAAR